MDNIINKNIFNDRDLDKLSPDYVPLDFFLRMQMRRTLAKDTHNHGVLKSTTVTRKSIKKTKDSNYCNIHREIAKLRQEFSNMNLKNKISLKEFVRPKLKTQVHEKDYLTNELCEEVLGHDDIIHKFSNDMMDLEIRNDNEFKLNTKIKPLKHIKYYRETTNIEKKTVNDINASIDLNKDINENNEDILKIECIYNPGKAAIKDNCNENNNSTEFDKEYVNSHPVNNLDMPVSDLKKLLIMMALSSRSNDEENCNELAVNITVETPTEYKGENINNDKSNKEISNECVIDEGIDNVINVMPIRVQITDKQKCLMKKVVTKWRNYVDKRKKRINEEREARLNSFFDRIARKKMGATEEHENTSKHLLKDYNKYEHRYRMQKHIIALQKAKLEEQYRLIEELKYNRIIEASRHSVDAMREEVRKTYYDLDRQLKPKIKCLTNELKIQEIQEPALVLHCLKVPQFLQRMERRAREREEKHAIIRERRRQMEEERIRLKQQAELAKAEMDKEEKIKRIKELKEKRKKERVENIRKKIWAERIRGLVVMADLHYEKYLKAKYGIRPFRRLLEIKHDNIEKAKVHYTFQLQNNVFMHWMWHTEDMWYERNFKAEDFYRKKLMKKVFKGFRMVHHNLLLKKQVAEDYYDFYITLMAFRMFCEGVEIVRKENELEMEKAVSYYNSNLIFKAFTCWRTLPAINALQREQELRKARWREKVLQVVPDYTPPDD